MQPTTQQRTNHLGYDVGSSRKIPDGTSALVCFAPTKCLESGKPNVLTLVALTLFRFLCLAYRTVKVALKATAAVFDPPIVGEAQEKAHAPTFQIQVKVDGATVMLDAGSAWTAADVKAALHTKIGRASGGYYLVAGSGKPLNDGAATTLAALGVGPGDQLELRGRLRGGMPSQTQIRAAFALYDTNGDGQLSPDELKAIMCRPAANGTPRTEAEVDEIVRQFDADGDGMLSMEEIAKAWADDDTHVLTSYWDEVGPEKPNASALKRALVDTVLVDAAWLAQLADEGGVLPRCQDLPPGARVRLEEMEEWQYLDMTLAVLVISYPWLDADHPDKDGLQLRAISHVLEIFAEHAKYEFACPAKVGVFLDYVSMPQRSRGSSEDDRTPEELATFKRSLMGINLWYGHPMTHVLLVDTDLPAGAHTNMQPYAGRGWCVMERKASGLVKDNTALISLRGLTGEEEYLAEVRKNGRVARETPVAPTAFASTLEAGVASGATKFTNSGDVGLVATIYGKAFAAEMAAVVSLGYGHLGWDDTQMLAVCETLRAAHAGGGLTKLVTLDLSSNQMGEGAMAALVALVEEGAMPQLEGLALGNNQISDAGIAALATALRGGALPSCTSIYLDDNPGSDTPVEEELKSVERMTAVAQNASHMAAVVELPYAGLGWDDAQVLTVCQALRAAHAGGGLKEVQELNLSFNKMGDGAMAALAALLEEGAMPKLERLRLQENQISDAGVAALVTALRGGAIPACAEITLRFTYEQPAINLSGNPGCSTPVQEALAWRQDMAPAVTLSYSGLGWDDAQMLTLCGALRVAHAGGGLRKLESLNLRENKMGDRAMAALVALLEEGAMPNLETLILSGNQIPDAGVAALATALRSGALPSCRHVHALGNPGCGGEGVDEDGDPDGTCPRVEEALASPEREAALARRQDE